ncbi:alpha-glucosidase [Saccharibacillus sp. JS10]|uniref:glycoside hydrolase family 13 protein n=1 Tax=Saccharibacillus sp. JS10 TaxID=2950552 RepID=UPI00210DD059|nr:alpha-glucosidase [Saccharibacillus sp. JS10]MCQ4086227.1 alpha-glucosidase [Saccharibacillus sp. JS10]
MGSTDQAKAKLEGVIYQLYPPSFKDSNGDGWGDLGGMLAQVEYLAELGISAVWIGPICDSPMEDNGYDIRDYYKIHDAYGTMEQLEELIAKLHEHDIKLMMDLVLNHTSDEHSWFEQSRSSKTNPYRDYYIWQPPSSNGEPPNNWRSFSEDSAWEWEEETGEYYLHIFDKKQPDLNWENKKMREELYTMINFWLDKGVDGFRLDAINMISKHPDFPDAPDDARHPKGQQFYKNGPKIHEFLQELHEATFGRVPGTLTLGEAPTVTMDEVILYTAPERKELDMVLQMEMIRIGKDYGHPWKNDPHWSPELLKESIVRWYKNVFGKGAYALYLNTHDHPRMIGTLFGDVSEIGGAEGKALNVAAAKAIGTFLHTLPGTPIVYQGEELGMPNADYDHPDQYRDKGTLSAYHRRIQAGESEKEILASFHARSRDGARSPMHWTGGEYAGFSEVEPWIPMSPQGKEFNAEAERSDPHSVFHHYRRLIQFRRESPILTKGDLDMLPIEEEWILAYTRTYEQETWLIILNFSDQPQTCLIDAKWSFVWEEGECLISHPKADVLTHSVFSKKEDPIKVDLLPYQSLVYRKR